MKHDKPQGLNDPRWRRPVLAIGVSTMGSFWVEYTNPFSWRARLDLDARKDRPCSNG